ncbi:MAG TPA: NAD(P)-dependent oxidoreductase [Caulobacterales bacterium]|nr:NAD(P)-dependent oxidoreductase [Caulobacterales bacterium]
MIAWLGTGLLGANFVRALRKRGEEVRLWNRTHAKAEALGREVGASAFENPADAVRGASLVHIAVSADDAVDDLLEKARPGFAPGVIVIDHTTTSPPLTRERVRRWDERGVKFLHAPVMMGPPNALNGTGTMMVSGEKARFDAVAASLKPMTGNLVYVGPAPDRAAAFKLMGNMMLMSMTVAIIEALKLGKAFGMTPAEASSMFEWLQTDGQVPARLKRILEGDFANPYWELHMARKDARLMMEASDQLLAMPGVAAAMDRWIAQGHAHDDWLIISRDAV